LCKTTQPVIQHVLGARAESSHGENPPPTPRSPITLAKIGSNHQFTDKLWQEK